MIRGTEQAITEGVVVARAVVVVGRWLGRLNDLRELTLAVVRLVTAVFVAGIIVVSRACIGGTCRAIGLARRSLGGVLDNALLFLECDELIDVIVCIIELQAG